MTLELSGHPSEDLLSELIERGAVVVEGGRDGPEMTSSILIPPGPGAWLWVPEAIFETDIDDDR